MSMSVTKGSSSPGHEAAHASIEKVNISWTTGDGTTAGLVSDTVNLVGQVLEVITIPGGGSTYPSDSYAVQLRDPDNSAVDYLNGGVTGHSDAVTFHEPMVGTYQPVSVAGDVEFWLSDASGTSDASGVVTLFLKT